MLPRVFYIHYKLFNHLGDVVDTSIGGEPLVFLEGAKQVPSGLESAVLERQPGEKLEVEVPPAAGYGERRDDLVQRLDPEQFSGVENLQPGMLLQTQSGEQRQVVKVIEVSPAGVLVDANHPLAGITLVFEVEIKAVRDATSEELKQGVAIP